MFAFDRPGLHLDIAAFGTPHTRRETRCRRAIFHAKIQIQQSLAALSPRTLAAQRIHLDRGAFGRRRHWHSERRRHRRGDQHEGIHARLKAAIRRGNDQCRHPSLHHQRRRAARLGHAAGHPRQAQDQRQRLDRLHDFRPARQRHRPAIDHGNADLGRRRGLPDPRALERHDEAVRHRHERRRGREKFSSQRRAGGSQSRHRGPNDDRESRRRRLGVGLHRRRADGLLRRGHRPRHAERRDEPHAHRADHAAARSPGFFPDRRLRSPRQFRPLPRSRIPIPPAPRRFTTRKAAERPRFIPARRSRSRPVPPLRLTRKRAIPTTGPTAPRPPTPTRPSRCIFPSR